MFRYVACAVALLAAPAASAFELSGRTDLPACTPGVPQASDCHITGWDMAINMMTSPPSQARQPNAYAEYLAYEHDRDLRGNHPLPEQPRR